MADAAGTASSGDGSVGAPGGRAPGDAGPGAGPSPPSGVGPAPASGVGSTSVAFVGGTPAGFVGRTAPAIVGRTPLATRRRLIRAGPAGALLAVAAPLTLVAPPARAQGAATASPIPASLRVALREGGCVLVLRHAITEPGTGDPPGFRLGDCTSQRNLDARGREQSRRLGEVMREAGVPIGEVRSSRWCRCVETARIAFGRVEPWPPLDSFFADASTREGRTARVREWALSVRGPSNAVAVTHQVNVTALTGVFPGMGETLVLRPSGDALRLVGRFAA